jgi:pimeloyl-ACP methyl ester carboxylesterase
MTTDARARAWPPLDRVLLGLVVLVVALMAFASWRIAGRATTFRGAPPAVTPADSGLAFDEVPLRARDGTKLSGWWIRPGDGVRRRDLAVVVLVHDLGESKAAMLPEAAELVRAGFIVLAPDLRAHGASEGTTTTGGFLEADDVAAAVQLAHERALGAPVVLHGAGSGALAAGRLIARDPTVRGITDASQVLSYEEALLGRRDVAGDPLFPFALPFLVRELMARRVGHGFRPGELGSREMWGGPKVRWWGTFYRSEAGSRRMREEIEKRLAAPPDPP